MLDLFRVAKGIQIESDDLLSDVSVLFGVGAPGGDNGDQDNANIGSLYLRTDAGPNSHQLYYKFSSGSPGSPADWQLVASQSYVDAVAAGLSWREPVRVLDNTLYANVAAAQAAYNAASPQFTADGVQLVDGDRVLLTNLTSGNENVYVVDISGSPLTLTLTEDVNSATDGDALLVTDGSFAETQWVFDGASWIQFATPGAAAELQFIRDFIGKNAAGAENPSYSSTNVVAQGSNLETAVGALDNAFGDGEIANDGGNYSLSDDLTFGASGTLTVTDALDELNNAVGNRTYTQDNFVTDGQSVAASVDALDIAVGDLSDQFARIAATNVDANPMVTIDTLPLTVASEAKWMVQVRENGTPLRRRAVEIHALNDGVSVVDHTEFAILRFGGNIAGFNIDVDISGADMRLRLQATNNVDYVVKRMGYATF